MRLNFRIIILEGKTDEVFLEEYISRNYEVRISRWKKYKKPNFSKLIHFENIEDYNIVTVIAGSKDNIIPTVLAYIKSIETHQLPNIEKILILRDLDNLTKENINQSYGDSFRSRYNDEVSELDFGFTVKNTPIHIIPIGNIEFTHQVDNWGHTLEDYLIEAIQIGENDEFKIAYDNIIVDAINIGKKLNLPTCCKSPLNISMAFSGVNISVEGFYRKLIDHKEDSINEILTRTGFKDALNTFLYE